MPANSAGRLAAWQGSCRQPPISGGEFTWDGSGRAACACRQSASSCGWRTATGAAAAACKQRRAGELVVEPIMLQANPPGSGCGPLLRTPPSPAGAVRRTISSRWASPSWRASAPSWAKAARNTPRRSAGDKARQAQQVEHQARAARRFQRSRRARAAASSASNRSASPAHRSALRQSVATMPGLIALSAGSTTWRSRLRAKCRSALLSSSIQARPCRARIGQDLVARDAQQRAHKPHRLFTGPKRNRGVAGRAQPAEAAQPTALRQAQKHRFRLVAGMMGNGNAGNGGGGCDLCNMARNFTKKRIAGMASGGFQPSRIGAQDGGVKSCHMRRQPVAGSKTGHKLTVGPGLEAQAVVDMGNVQRQAPFSATCSSACSRQTLSAPPLTATITGCGAPEGGANSPCCAWAAANAQEHRV